MVRMTLSGAIAFRVAWKPDKKCPFFNDQPPLSDNFAEESTGITDRKPPNDSSSEQPLTSHVSTQLVPEGYLEKVVKEEAIMATMFSPRLSPHVDCPLRASDLRCISAILDKTALIKR